MTTHKRPVLNATKGLLLLHPTGWPTRRPARGRPGMKRCSRSNATIRGPNRCILQVAT